MLQMLVAYNFLCCALSIYTLIGFAICLQTADHLYVMKSSSSLTPIFQVYWITKNIELLDTVFMVLRHKARQITVLHIFHHSSMILLSDYAYHHTPWPAIAVFLCLNSMVHVVLYIYYGLTAMNPENPPLWKQRLTEIQIAQFLIDMVFAGFGYLYHGFCIYGILYGVIMTYMFSSFYYQAYIKAKNHLKRK